MAESHYPGPDSIFRQVLPNGITVLVYENFASESIVIEGVVRAGALAEETHQAGLANFTASCLMRGTEKRSFEQIYEDMESVGASLGFSSGNHTTGFSASSLIEDADLILELMAQSLRWPSFPQAQVEQVRGQIITSLQMRANDTRRMASLIFNETLYPEHPYGRSTLGYLDSIHNISRDDLAEFHHDWYGPEGMILTMVGAIDKETAIAKANAVFGDWDAPHQKQMPAAPPAARPEQTIRTFTELPEKSQSDIFMGLPGPQRSAVDYMDASLMNTILGVFGMMGRIGQTVREEQGLAYYAYSRLQGGLGPSPWYVSAGVAPENVEKAIESILQEIRRIQEELVSDEELSDSQAYRTGSLPVGLETNGGLSSVIADMEFYGLGLDFLQRYPALVNEITPERVRAAARKYLSVDQIAISVAGPRLPELES